MVNGSVLKEKSRVIKSFKGVSPEAVDKIEAAILSMADEGYIRINPYKLAEYSGVDSQTAANYLIYGTKVGLFDFEWNLICPFCGMNEHHYSIKEINFEDFYCPICDVRTEIDLSGQVEVAFKLNKFADESKTNIYMNEELYQNYNFSQNAVFDIRFLNEKNLTSKGFYVAEPDTAARITIEAKSGETLRIVSFEARDALFCEITPLEDGEEIERLIDIDVTQNGFSSNKIKVKEGKITLVMHNRMLKTLGLIANMVSREDIYKMLGKYPMKMNRFFTAKELLNNQIFREQFKMDDLPKDLSLKVGNITVLFTDLKNSTMLYDRTGDIKAYNLVQEHFEILVDILKKNNGALVKTIGDAVMATFSNPYDAVFAAVDMRNSIERMKERYSEYKIDFGIKIGLHEGSALAVNANNLIDYFGHTVNLAARVQGLAGEGEIWMTQQIFEKENVKLFMENNNLKINKQSASLKGIEEEVIVYKCW